MTILFWISFAGIFYAYFGYPLLLLFLGKIKKVLFFKPQLMLEEAQAPSVTLIIPAYNEESIIGEKLENTLSLYYPGELHILVVSDGSSDTTVSIVNKYLSDSRVELFELTERKGKAQALNKALQQVKTEIIIFSDASIILEQQALWHIVQPFANSKIGCVSGEDHIEGGGGEGLYGKYELFLRDKESQLDSIVGASGSFYAQRTALVTPFQEGLAPDFVSVMNTVERGYRAISHPDAIGSMVAVKSHKDEFNRKVRTFIRGMTAMFKMKHMLNPVSFPMFSFFLWSHKMMRWFVPFFLISLMVSNFFILDNNFYRVILIAQLLFYGMALLGFLGVKIFMDSILGKIAIYFTSVNVAILLAWVRYLMGVRQEIWSPSKRH